MNNQKTLHTLNSPNSADAFSQSVVKNRMTSNVDFDIPDDIWDAIDVASAHYWNEILHKFNLNKITDTE